MTPLEELVGMRRAANGIANSHWSRLPEDLALAGALLFASRACTIAEHEFGFSRVALGSLGFGLAITAGPEVYKGPCEWSLGYDAIETVRGLSVGVMYDVVAQEIWRLEHAIRRGRRCL